VGLGNASDVWRGWIGLRKLASFFGQGPREAAAARQHHHVFSRRRREGTRAYWMSVWVDDVDEMHKHCSPPAGGHISAHRHAVERREMHLRHPMATCSGRPRIRPKSRNWLPAEGA